MRMDIPKVVDSVTADETVVRVIESCILEWWVSCHHCEQDYAESEKVSDLAAVWNVHDDLRRHVALRAGKVFSLKAASIACFDRTGNSKVTNFNVEVFVK